MKKTRKAIVKRFKFTRTGKILRRATGQDHFRAKKTGGAVRKSRKWIAVSKNETRRIKKLLK